MDRIYIKHLGKVEDVDVWLVDNNTVKVLFDIDFIEGANGRARWYVPPNEIWIADYVPDSQKMFVIAHEFVEYSFMGDGLSYEDAHKKANEIEQEIRTTDYIKAITLLGK